MSVSPEHLSNHILKNHPLIDPKVINDKRSVHFIYITAIVEYMRYQQSRITHIHLELRPVRIHFKGNFRICYVDSVINHHRFV